MKLYPHQSEALAMLRRENGGAVWAKVGTGKTSVALLWFASLAKSFTTPKFVVVCRRQAFYDWREEVAKLELDFGVLEADCAEDFYLQRQRRPVIFLISHGQIQKLEETLADPRVTACCFDEGFLYKNPSTAHSKSANRISKAVSNSSILSGSLMTARDVTDIYGQLYAINRHETLAPNLTSFRSKFLIRFQIGSTGRFDFSSQKDANKRIISKVSRFCYRYFPKGGRQEQHIIRRIPPTKRQAKLVGELKNIFLLDYGEESIQIKNTPSLIAKCQQISDGCIKMATEWFDVESSKLAYLLGLVAEILSEGGRIVIWCAFRKTVKVILQGLQKEKGVYSLVGGSKFDSINWLRNGRICVATVGSGSSVNHFKNCQYAIYYSMDFKWINLQQSRGRTNRSDSKHLSCIYYYLFTIGSLDEMVYHIATNSMTEEKQLIELKQWLNK